MTELTDKEKVIKEVYEDKEHGYGSLRDTYQQAYKKDPSIRYEDVKKYLDKLSHRQTQFKYKGFNSFISPQPLFEIEVDLIDLTSKAEQNDGFRYCMVAIDNFTKFAWAVAIKTKSATDLVNAFTEILEKIGIPKQMYSDQEPAFDSFAFIRLLNKHKIKHITSISGAHTVERFNRTLKEKIQTRLDAMGLSRDKWLEQLKPIINKYNNTEHSTTKIKPVEAGKPYNRMWVWWHINNEAKRDRKYPKISENDNVRIKINQKKTAKGHDPTFTKEIYKVVSIKDGEYFIPGYHKHRMWNRHELLLV